MKSMTYTALLRVSHAKKATACAMTFLVSHLVFSSRGGTRTPDRVINSHLLYLAELPGNIDGRRRRLTQPRTAMQEHTSIVTAPD